MSKKMYKNKYLLPNTILCNNNTYKICKQNKYNFGDFLKLKPKLKPIKKTKPTKLQNSDETQDSFQQQTQSNYDVDYAVEVPCATSTNFSWPPLPSEDDRRVAPTASPIYIPPPGTQHIQPKSKLCIDSTSLQTDQTAQIEHKQSTQIQNVIDMVPASWLTQESRSAPELTSINLREANEYTESCSASDSYTSTCTTTTTTSEEYQRMYSAHSALMQSQYYDQSSIDLNSSNCDFEIVSIQQQNGSFSSTSTDLLPFSGRRSTQECADSLYNTINTTQLVEYLKDNVSQEDSSNYPTTSKPTKRVEFSENVAKVASESLVQSFSSSSDVEQNVPSIQIQTIEENANESKF